MPLGNNPKSPRRGMTQLGHIHTVGRGLERQVSRLQRQHQHGRTSDILLTERRKPRKNPHGIASLCTVFKPTAQGCTCMSGENGKKRPLFYFYSLCCTHILDKLFNSYFSQKGFLRVNGTIKQHNYFSS